MSYIDRSLYQALVLLEAAADGDEHDGARAYRSVEKSGVDPIHVAQHLASMLAPVIKQNPDWRRILDDQLEQARLIAAADLGSDEGIFTNETSKPKKAK